MFKAIENARDIQWRQLPPCPSIFDAGNQGFEFSTDSPLKLKVKDEPEEEEDTYDEIIKQR